MAKRKPAKRKPTKTYGPTVREGLGKLAPKLKVVSNLETAFENLWHRHGNGPEPLKQFRFAPPRLYRFDFSWPESRVAVEIDGGTQGRPLACHACGATVRARNIDGSLGRVMMVPHASHGSADGIQSGCEKNNLAVRMGWVIFRYTSIDIRERPLQMIEEVREVVLARQTSAAIRQKSIFQEEKEPW